VLHAVESGSGSAGHPDLGVDVLDVVLSRARRNMQALCDLAIRQALSHEPQYLDLSIAKARWSNHRPLRRTACGIHNGSDRVGIESSRGGIVLYAFSCLVDITSRAMWPGLSHRLQGIRSSQDASRHWYVSCIEAPVVAGTVHALVVHPRNRGHR
jgi:hypothetical protein